MGAYHCTVRICSPVGFSLGSEFTCKVLQVGTEERFEESSLSFFSSKSLHLSLIDGNAPAVHSFSSFLEYPRQTPEIFSSHHSLYRIQLLLLMYFFFFLLAPTI